MKFKIHNKLEIFTHKKQHTFFNTMFKNAYEKYKTFDGFNNYISIGGGEKSNSQNEYKLTNKILNIKLETDTIQNDISKGQLFIKKTFILEQNICNGEYIKELGITDSESSDVVYNYFSLVNEELPNGILKNNEKLIGVIYIYLDINYENENFKFLNCSNTFINYLLGEKSNNSLEVCLGDYCYNDNNEIIFQPNINKKLPILTQININENCELSINLNLKKLTINSLFLIFNNQPIAIIKLQNYYNSTKNSTVFVPKKHFILDLGEDIKSVDSIKNTNSNLIESEYFIKNYADEYGSKIDTDLLEIFNKTNPKYISNNGKFLIFIKENKVYIFKNENYTLKQINTNELTIHNIKNICCVENFLFIFTNFEPYIFTFFIDENNITKINVNYANFNKFNILKNAIKYSIAKTHLNEFMIGIINEEDKNGYTFYFSFNTTNLDYISHLVSNHNFSYTLAISANNYCDARIIYLEEGEYSYNSRIVTHLSDKSETDVYSSLAYTLTKDAKEIYVKDKAIIVEKNTSPKIQIYHYPQVYQYLFPDIENEKDYFVSNNLLYIAIKRSDDSIHFYNLVGFNESFEFKNNFPDDINTKEIKEILFLNDIFLVISSNENDKIKAYSLKQNKKLIENISSNTDNYLVDYTKYNFLGSNNEEVNVNILITISL